MADFCTSVTDAPADSIAATYAAASESAKLKPETRPPLIDLESDRDRLRDSGRLDAMNQMRLPVMSRSGDVAPESTKSIC